MEALNYARLVAIIMGHATDAGVKLLETPVTARMSDGTEAQFDRCWTDGERIYLSEMPR